MIENTKMKSMNSLLIDHQEVKNIRSVYEVGARSIILYAIILARYEEFDKKTLVQQWLINENLWAHVSPSEKLFLEDPDPERQAVINATWKAECIWVLCWLLKKVDLLSPPTHKISQKDIHFMKVTLPRYGQPTHRYLEGLELRSPEEIFRELEKIYQIHWAMRNAKMRAEPPMEQFDQDVVLERHRTLNWVTNPGDEWDEITTDT